MDSKDRRKLIIKILNESDKPYKGQDLAEKFNVTRQIIVKDVAILRAEGNAIIATPEGYLFSRVHKESVKRVVALSHKRNDIEEELKSIVKFGGTIKDVIIEHQLYGEIRAMLMIKTYYDIQSFINKLNENNAKPLSLLTNGVHLHTIEAENEQVMNNILLELEQKDFLITDS